MKDPDHIPVFLICGKRLREAREPFRGFNGTECDANPAAHFLRYQHSFGGTPANDTTFNATTSQGHR